MHSQVIVELEQAVLPVKKTMEARGLRVDQPKLEALIADSEQTKQLLEDGLKAELGITCKVNFNSARDVSKILVSTLGVQPTRTRTGRLSTNRKLLKAFNNPLTDKINHYRELEKLISSLKAIHAAVDKTSGKIFCTYDDKCPSGRLYTKNYSFQSICEQARNVIYADDGCSFVLADFESFELRILSALAGDKYFRSCWEQGLDLHRKVVSDMQNIPYGSVTDKQRKLGKILNFGLSYGQEPTGLARNLHIAVPEAEKLMSNYKRQIPEIEKFKLEVIKIARQTGYTETFHGRRRYLPNITSPRGYDRAKSERQAVNTKIQGTAADIVKFAIVSLHRAGFKIDTMIHDSVLITVPNNEVTQSITQIKSIMESVEIEGMKFPVSERTGRLWSECYKKTT